MKRLRTIFTRKSRGPKEESDEDEIDVRTEAAPSESSGTPGEKPSDSSVLVTRNTERLDTKLVDVFCRTFGEQYRDFLTPETDMDAIEDWSSLTYLELVFALEAAYGVTFTEDESAQMFQLGHIQRIVRHAVLDLPHDDVAHACCQLQQLRRAPDSQYKIVILSGSSTREGFVTPSEGLTLLREMSGSDDVGWYNISVSGLVVAETLQLVELIGSLQNGLVVIGFSPIILGGCGEAEFERTATHERFPFAAPLMENTLTEAGYPKGTVEKPPLIPLDIWLERYLKDRSLDELQYEPYLYPTLEPWPQEKFRDEESILRFYNRSILNYDESIRINTRLLRIILAECRRRSLAVSFIELALHSETGGYLERLGRVLTRTREVAARLRDEFGVEFIQAVKDVGITDADFRDPAHLFRKRQEYTRAAIAAFLRIKPPS